MKNSYITVTDQFCGAGGSSQGVRNVSKRYNGGLEVKLALNHWKLAIETHNTNFPNTLHDCTDISACDPRRYPSTDILITSPECTNHSLAKGIKKANNQMDMFKSGVLDPAAERSRATMWDVPRFAEYHQYNLIIVENVVDARKWVMWDAWLHSMYLLGYLHKCVYMNSMHAHPTPQSRDRMYVVFWKKGNKAPDLEFMPKAYCEHCDSEIDSVQSWRNVRKQYGKYRQQYDYRCPKCSGLVEPYYYAAFNVIDWSIPGKRIGDRKKSLASNTISRIEHGLEKYKNSEFIIYLDHSKSGALTSSGRESLRTQTTAQVAAIVTRGGYKGDSFSIGQPEPTITTQHNFGVVGVPHQPFIIENFGTSKCKEIDKPIGAITTNTNYGILSNESVNAFLSYYYGNDTLTDISSPVGTMTTKERAALVLRPTGKVDIEDCTYRMLIANEVQRAMAFDDDYIVCGNGRDQVKQLGNAVTPPAMDWLIDRAVKSLN